MNNPSVIAGLRYALRYDDNFIPRNKTEKKLLDDSKWARCLKDNNLYDYDDNDEKYVNKQDDSLDKNEDNEAHLKNALGDDASELDVDAKELAREILNARKIDKPSIVGYVSDRGGSSGTFSKDGFFSDEEGEKVKEELRKTKSIVWYGFFSLNDKLSPLMRNKETALRIFQKVMPRFINDAKLNPDNVKCYGAFHNNTDNSHEHFYLYEDKASHCDKNGNPLFRQRGNINKRAIENLKFNVTQELTNNQLSYAFRNYFNTSLRSLALNQDFTLGVITRLSKKLSTNIPRQYMDLKEDDKTLVQSAFDLLCSNKNVANAMTLFKSEIRANQKKINDVYKMVDGREPTNDYKDAMYKALDLTVGNKLLKMVIHYRQYQINLENETIEENKFKSYYANLYCKRKHGIITKKFKKEFSKSYEELENLITNNPFKDKSIFDARTIYLNELRERIKQNISRLQNGENSRDVNEDISNQIDEDIEMVKDMGNSQGEIEND